MEHGTWSMYCNAKCRCDRCRKAARGYLQTQNYGITPEQVETLALGQGGVCAACGEVPGNKNGFHVDHDHSTGKIRGLLCHGCNLALGNLKDDPARISGLYEYLIRAR